MGSLSCWWFKVDHIDSLDSVLQIVHLVGVWSLKCTGIYICCIELSREDFWICRISGQ